MCCRELGQNGEKKMTREEFEQLAGAGVILLDGATGSNLTKAGMPKGVSTELWVLEHPDILANLQKAYVEAGSQIVYAPTFGANRLKLADYGRENEVEELNARLVDISKKALAGTGALIAGDFSTPGKMLQPKGDLSYEELLESYTEQVTAVANAGVDLLIAETMLSVDETCVFMDAALSVCDLPIMCSLTLEADGSALFGGNAVEAVETLQEMGASAVLVRENRLYQADWLLRFYQFRVDELVDDASPDLDLEVDPKLAWALRHPEFFPVNILTADYEALLRVPGIGVRSARLIVLSRRFSRIGLYDLKRMGAVVKKARYFITCHELPDKTILDLGPAGVRKLLLPRPARKTDDRQLSFDFQD